MKDGRHGFESCQSDCEHVERRPSPIGNHIQKLNLNQILSEVK